MRQHSPSCVVWDRTSGTTDLWLERALGGRPPRPSQVRPRPLRRVPACRAPSHSPPSPLSDRRRRALRGGDPETRRSIACTHTLATEPLRPAVIPSSRRLRPRHGAATQAPARRTIATRQLMGRQATLVGTTPAPTAIRGGCPSGCWSPAGGVPRHGPRPVGVRQQSARPVAVGVTFVRLGVTPSPARPPPPFVAAGGTTDDRWWSPAGWAGAHQAGLEAPRLLGATATAGPSCASASCPSPARPCSVLGAGGRRTPAGRAACCPRRPSGCAAGWDPATGRAAAPTLGDEATDRVPPASASRTAPPRWAHADRRRPDGFGFQPVGDAMWTSSNFPARIPAFSPFTVLRGVLGAEYKVAAGRLVGSGPVAVRSTFLSGLPSAARSSRQVPVRRRQRRDRQGLEPGPGLGPDMYRLLPRSPATLRRSSSIPPTAWPTRPPTPGQQHGQHRRLRRRLVRTSTAGPAGVHRDALPMWADRSFASFGGLVALDRGRGRRGGATTPAHRRAARLPFGCGPWLFALAVRSTASREGGRRAAPPAHPERESAILGAADSEFLFRLALAALDGVGARRPPARSSTEGGGPRSGWFFCLVLTDGRVLAATRAGDSLWRLADGSRPASSPPGRSDDDPAPGSRVPRHAVVLGRPAPSPTAAARPHD